MGPAAHALDAQHAFVVLPCRLGPHWSSSLAFIARRDGGASVLLVPPTPYLGNVPKPLVLSSLGDFSFDLTKGMLNTGFFTDPWGTCGFNGHWIWNGEQFVLAQMELQSDCGGVERGGWPPLFRSVQ